MIRTNSDLNSFTLVPVLSQGHDYTLMLNQAYRTLMREESRSRYDTACGRRSEWSGSNFSGLGYSSWNGPLGSQALFVDEHRCIGGNLMKSQSSHVLVL